MQDLPRTQVLHLEEGDTLVFTADRVLTADDRAFIAAAARDILDRAGVTNVRSVVLEAGLSLSVVSPSQGAGGVESQGDKGAGPHGILPVELVSPRSA